MSAPTPSSASHAPPGWSPIAPDDAQRIRRAAIPLAGLAAVLAAATVALIVAYRAGLPDTNPLSGLYPAFAWLAPFILLDLALLGILTRRWVRDGAVRVDGARRLKAGASLCIVGSVLVLLFTLPYVAYFHPAPTVEPALALVAALPALVASVVARILLARALRLR